MLPTRPATLSIIPVLLLAVFLACGRQNNSSMPSASANGRSSAIRAEVERRAAGFTDDNVLVANFYRIHRKLAYPLPVTEINHPDFFVTGISDYPWEIWMTWDLEQRVYALGWAAQWTGNERYKELVRTDLEALAGWPDYDARRTPHLSGAHAARLLAGAYTSWDWLGDRLRAKIEQALGRFVDGRPEWLGDGRLELATEGKVLAAGGRLLQNIPTIATIGRSIAARISHHKLEEKLERHTEALVMAQLQLRDSGYTEAVGYDGYIMDFVADWLPGAGPEFREKFFASSELKLMLSQSWITSTPGNLMNVAPFNDVEPREMPFHASAHAKLAALAGADSRETWFLNDIPLSWLRTDALAALDAADLTGGQEMPAAGAKKSLTSVVLRSGWSGGDLAVAMSACEATPGHIQHDNGTLVIGSGGKWLIDDPGYQQYVPGLEREFTLGPTAHNYPVIGDSGVQITNKVKILECGGQDGLYHAAVDFTAGYDSTAGVSRVMRQLWLAGDSLVVVGDLVEFVGRPQAIGYHWQANPEAALWLDGGSCLVSVDNISLWVGCADEALDGGQIRLLPGSRGQITIGRQIPAAGRSNHIWWIFKRGERPASYLISSDHRELNIGGIRWAMKNITENK